MAGKKFYSVSISFIVGTLFFSFVHLPLAFLFLSAIVFVAIASISSKTQVIICISLLAFLLGGIRMEISTTGSHPLDKNIGKSIDEKGFICDEPTQGELSQSLCFKGEGRDKILVTTGSFVPYEYGDEVEISGKLTLPKNFTAYEGGPEFDYISYLSKDDIRYVIYMPKIRKLGGFKGSRLIFWLFRLKKLFTQKMEELIPEPDAALLGGLLLGDRQSMPKSVINDFKRAGLVHILVLSGYNVTIIGQSLMKVFSFLPRLFGMSLGAISIVLFALMTGAAATTIRATIMALIALFAKSLGGKYDASRALIAAAVMMIMQNPRIAAFDVSFQLSFLATLALMYISPLVRDALFFVTERWNLRDMLSTTIATQIFVLPFLLYVMGQTSIIAFVSNPFVLPAVPYTMLLGFISIVIGFLNLRLALPMAFMTNLLLSYIIRTVAFFSHMPFAIIEMHAGAITLACTYIVYTAILIFLWRRRNYSRMSAS